MSQNIVIAIFKDSSLQTLLVSTGKDRHIQTTSQSYNYIDQGSLFDAFKKSLQEINSDSCLGQFSQIALVLPYTWIDSDGKINKSKNKTISTICQKHNLKPIGFISSDEAILDYFNQEQGVPSSPVLINIQTDNITISLSDMGIIKKRLSCPAKSQDNIPQVCEDTIIKLKDDFSITPKIFVWGQFSRQTVLDFNNFTWVDKQKPDIFLHFPDIIFLEKNQVLELFLNTINSQLVKDLSDSPDSIQKSPKQQSEPEPEAETPSQKDDLPTPISTEVEASTLGFSSSASTHSFNFPINQDTPKLGSTPLPITKPVPNKPKFKLPTLNLSKKWFYFLLIPVILIPLFLFIFIYRVNIDVFVTPIDIDLTSQVKIDASIQQSDFNQAIIAVKSESKTIVVEDEVRTTGTKTVGERAQGKVTIFNKTDQPISLNQGQILTTDSGLGFELLNDIEVDASSTDLDQGLISMGKTSVVVAATDIGSQSNIVQDTPLALKDLSQSDLIAKVEESFAGGSSRQIQSVDKNDKDTLQNRLDELIDQTISQNQPDQTDKYILPSTIQIKQSNIEFNREIGEEADILSASQETVISYYVVLSQEESAIVNYMSSVNDFDQAIDPTNSSLNFDFVPIADQAGNLLISGQAIPRADLNTLKKQLILKSNKNFVDVIKSNIQRVYDYNLRSNSPFGHLPILPALDKNINIIIKTEL